MFFLSINSSIIIIFSSSAENRQIPPLIAVKDKQQWARILEKATAGKAEGEGGTEERAGREARWAERDPSARRPA